ncbi:unnamed protein product [Arabis nemorensis]|uniref:Uncharacterized protein n=1 Tax=Arabis nemorensis TaxID=586526 RepID=A0A565B8N9_9BRAS|nr:unnamed protein product [Arabis nemorensis]
MENKREELENKRAELENAHNSTREELNQMKKTMKANFSGLFERKLSVGISPGMPMAKVDASSD